MEKWKVIDVTLLLVDEEGVLCRGKWDRVRDKNGVWNDVKRKDMKKKKKTTQGR